MGIPVVRGLGPGIPYDPSRDYRPRIRQAPAYPAHEGMVHASERTDSRLRMGFRRREPPGTCLGGVENLQYRKENVRQKGHPLPRERLPEAPPQLYLVGEQEGQGGEKRIRRRLSRTRQYRGIRQERAAPDGGSYRTGRRYELDGHVLPEHARHRARARERESQLRGHSE